ncbi:MAG: sulfatase-like hydrolase/transferase, partial [Ottowia sp.]|nr:sulfatase-like hydrolase/transferase [Ottowia sp.]
RDGLWLQQGYSSTPICSPTRTALLTGRYAQRYELGVEEPLAANARPDIGIPLGDPTIASVFHDRGYYTALIGKWHLGNPPIHGPLQHGYDYFYGLVEGAADYFRHHMVVGGHDIAMGLTRGNEPVNEDGYLTDMFGNEAIAAIDRAGDRPFFISLHFNAPHWPWEGREDRAVAEALANSQHYEG